MTIKYLDSKRIRGSSAGSLGTQSYNAGALTNVTLSNSNLTATATSSAWANIAYSTLTFNPANLASGAVYEFSFTTSDDTKNGMVGFDKAPASNSGAGNSTMDFGMYLVGNASSQNYISTAGGGSENWNGGQAYTTSSVLKMTMDSSGNVKFYIGGTQFGNTIAGGSGDYYVVFYPYDSGFNTTITSWSDPTQNEKATLLKFTDSLGSDADATLSGATANAATAINGKASLSFDGSNDIVTLGNDLDAITTEFTFSCWAYFASATASQHRTIISKPASGSWSEPYHSFTLQHASGSANVELVVNDGTTYRAVTVASGGVGWHFITVTKTSGNVWVLKVDDDTSATMTYSPTWGTQDWVIGNTPSQSRYWDGKIQDVAFWSRVLTGSEQTVLFNSFDNSSSTTSGNTGKVATDVGTSTGLKAYYTLNDTTTGVTNSAVGSDLPENTIFEETDTRKYYLLQSGAWVDLAAWAWTDTSFASNWTEVSGDDFSVSGGKITVAPATNNYALASFDLQHSTALGSGINASDTSWVLQFTVDQTTFSNNTANTYLDGAVMLSSVAGNSGDHVIFAVVNMGSKHGYRFVIVNGQTHTGLQEGGSSGTRNYQPSGVYAPSTTQGTGSDGKLGIRISRTSSTTFTYEICTDPTFVGGVTTTYNSDDATAAAAVTSLRYIQVGGYIGHSGGINGTNVFDIDDMKFWNGA